MEDDIDIYEDLPCFNIAENENYAKRNNELEKNCAELEKQVLELSGKLKTVQEEKANLEVNLSSLLKTAKAEISRKDRMLAEMRTKFENLAFKRGEYSKPTIKHRRSPDRNTRGREPEFESRDKPKIPEVPETPEVICEEPPTYLQQIEKKHTEKLHIPITSAMTVYQKRLHKRILEEQESERKQREDASAKHDGKPAAAVQSTTTTVDKGKESKSINDDKENQSDSVKLDHVINTATTTKSPPSHSSASSSVSQENCGFSNRKRATLVGQSNRKRSRNDQTDRDNNKKKFRADDSKVKYKDDSRHVDMTGTSSKTVKGSDGRDCRTHCEKREAKRSNTNRDDDMVCNDANENQRPDKSKLKYKNDNRYNDVVRPSSSIVKESGSRHCRTDLAKRDEKHADITRGDDIKFYDSDEYQRPDKGKVKCKDASKHADVDKPISKTVKESDSRHCKSDVDKREAKHTDAKRVDEILHDELDEYKIVDEYRSSPPPSTSVDIRNDCNKKSDVHSDSRPSETHNRLASRLMLLASGIEPNQHGSCHSEVRLNSRSNSDRRQIRRSDDTNSRSRSKSRDRESRQSRRHKSRSRSPDRRRNKIRSSRYKSSRDKFDNRRNMKNKDGDNLSEFSREIYELKDKMEHRLDDDRVVDQNENSKRSGKTGDKRGHADQSSAADKSRSSSNEKVSLKLSAQSESREKRRSRSSGRKSGIDAHSDKHSESKITRIVEEENAASVDKKESQRVENPDNTSMLSLEDGEILDTPESSPIKRKKADKESSTALTLPSAVHSTELEERSEKMNEEISLRVSLRLENTHSNDDSLFKEKTGRPVRISVRSKSLVDDLNTSREERIENIEQFIKNYDTLEGPSTKEGKINESSKNDVRNEISGVTVGDKDDWNKRIDSLFQNDPKLNTNNHNTTENIQNILSMESDTEIHKLLVAVEDDLNNPCTEWKLVGIDEDPKKPAGFLENYKKYTQQYDTTSKPLEGEKSEAKPLKTESNGNARSVPSVKKTVTKNKPVLNSLRLGNKARNQVVLSNSCTELSEVPSDDSATKSLSDNKETPHMKNPDEGVSLKYVDQHKTEITVEQDIGETDRATTETVGFSLEHSKPFIPSLNEKCVTKQLQPEMLVDLRKECSQLNQDFPDQSCKINSIEDTATNDDAAIEHESFEDCAMKNVYNSGAANPELSIGVEDSESAHVKLVERIEGSALEIGKGSGENSEAENPTSPKVTTSDKIQAKTVDESIMKDIKVKVEVSAAQITSKNKIDVDRDLRSRNSDDCKNAKTDELELGKNTTGHEVENPDKNATSLSTIQQNTQKGETISSVQLKSDTVPTTNILRSLLCEVPETERTTKSELEGTSLPKDSKNTNLKPIDSRVSGIISGRAKTSRLKAKQGSTTTKVVLMARRRRPMQLGNSDTNVAGAKVIPDIHSESCDSKPMLPNITEVSCETVKVATKIEAEPEKTMLSKNSEEPELKPSDAERSEQMSRITKISKSTTEICGTKSKNKNCKVVLMARRRRKPVQLEDKTIAMTVVISANSSKTDSNLEIPTEMSLPSMCKAKKPNSTETVQSRASLADDKSTSFERSGAGVPECLKLTNSASSSDSMNGCSSEHNSDSSQETWKP